MDRRSLPSRVGLCIHVRVPTRCGAHQAADVEVGRTNPSLIASARAPIILAGAGAIDARDTLIKLADRLEAPLATTLKAKGLFTGHKYDMDIFGTLLTPAAYELIDKSDCIVCFGTGLHSFTTDQVKLVKNKGSSRSTSNRPPSATACTPMRGWWPMPG